MGLSREYTTPQRAGRLPVPQQSSASADNVRGSSLSFNPALLLDALGTFPADTLTLHLRPMEDRQGKKPVLLTAGPDVAGDGYRHLLMPVRLDLIR